MARGMMILKKAAPRGIIAMKIMVVPCMVNMALKVSGSIKSVPGRASCIRIMPASIPPTRKNMTADTPYRTPILL